MPNIFGQRPSCIQWSKARIFALCLLSLSGSGFSQALFKCTDTAGKVQYTDHPCAADKQKKIVGYNDPDTSEYAQEKKRQNHQNVVNRNAALAERMQNDREREQFSSDMAQQRQLQTSLEIQNRMEAERRAKTSEVKSISETKPQEKPKATVCNVLHNGSYSSTAICR